MAHLPLRAQRPAISGYLLRRMPKLSCAGGTTIQQEGGEPGRCVSGCQPLIDGPIRAMRLAIASAVEQKQQELGRIRPRTLGMPLRLAMFRSLQVQGARQTRK